VSGAGAGFTLVVHVNPTTQAGTTITNTATIGSATFDSDASDNSATATTTVQQQTLLCFDGTTDTANGETGTAIYGGVCTLTGDRSAVLNNVPPGRDGAYSGVYFSPSALAGETIGMVSSVSFNYTGSVLEGNGPRFSIPINTGEGNIYLFIDARDCNNGAGLVDVINDSTCTIWSSADGTNPAATNWANLVTAHPGWTVNGLPFIIADGPGAWNLSNVHMGN
jgi:hypothetical protein